MAMTNGGGRPALPTFEGRPLAYPDEPVFDQGLRFDVDTLLDRRQVLKGLGLVAITAGIAACAPGAASSASAGASATSSATSPAAGSIAADCATIIPQETAGPFPGDGSNGPDVLNQSGIVRSDIRSTFGSSNTVAGGIPLTIRLGIMDASNACAAMPGAAVYIWHCDQEGRYSLYSDGVTGENYLRGVQGADSSGIVTFTSVFPACYSGRWPHIHFEVYPSLDKATAQGNKTATSQIALPKDTCDLVYATDGYSQSVANLARVSLQSDMVFGDDGGVHELGTISGDLSSGLTVELAVAVKGS
jgi:protocatechuate 3,4-dioxygenase beta subunit